MSPTESESQSESQTSGTEAPESEAGETVERRGGGKRRRSIPWLRYAILTGIIIVLGVVLLVLMTSFLPRWWAQTVGRQAGGSFSGGIGWGVFYGFIFTLFPLLIAGLAFLRRWKSIVLRVVFLLVGVVLAAPNLITLGVVVGTGGASHAGERIMDVQAPGFRGATLDRKSVV